MCIESSKMDNNHNLSTGEIQPPVAQEHDHFRVFHGDIFNDVYDWMKDKHSEQVQQYVAQQNTYADYRLRAVEGLKKNLFAELKSRVQETDTSVPVRMDGYWYFTRVQEGKQYGIQCRIPVEVQEDWQAPSIDVQSEPGSLENEQIVFDTNEHAKGYDFFQIGSMDISSDGNVLLYGVDTTGDERYDYTVKKIDSSEILDESLRNIGSATLSPDGTWVFYTVLDEAWRPCAVYRHKVGTTRQEDVEVFSEPDERFWIGVDVSFDKRHYVINANSKTTSEVLLLDTANPTGEFSTILPRQQDVEYDVNFACFERENEADIPVAIICHNAFNPNFEIDILDLRKCKPPFTLEQLRHATRIAQGSPYGCEAWIASHSEDSHVISDQFFDDTNPKILQGSRGLSVDGLSLYQHFVLLSYRSNGLTHLAYMRKQDALEDFLADKPWDFIEINPDSNSDTQLHVEQANIEVLSALNDKHIEKFELTPGSHVYSIGATSNPSYDAPSFRYGCTSFTQPSQLHEVRVDTREDVILRQSVILGDFKAEDYAERMIWIQARDNTAVPVSLVWKKSALQTPAPTFAIGYGAYEISSNPSFSVARLSMLDRGVLYVLPHIRGGGELGRAWYEQGRRLHKKHSFEDFIDAVRSVQNLGFADASRTVANGGSAGGLLMGAVANMAPECFAGIEADVPFVDALTSILDPTLPLTVTEWEEWGDPLHNHEVYEYMKSYSPYENAPDKHHRVQNFPQIFITTSMNDTRVLYVEPLKWLARLQSAGVDAFAKIEVEAGHGGVSGRYKQWEEVSLENAWCLSVMGITE
ncbi:MAG: prolyl oligopeptidase family serine peptidase [Bifidobacteriaceae bacterium]|nr:prolyl oligopeptidase family serine peptidase [Bifidobacteriaceae bacterium]